MNFQVFEHPDPTRRPLPFWSWNDLLEPGEMKRQMLEMVDKGWGGWFCHSRVGLVTGYLSDEWMERVQQAVETARDHQVTAWLYDEDKWPSGYAGGALAREEKHRDRCLMLLADSELTTSDKVFKRVKFKEQEYNLCCHVMPLGDEWFNGATYVDLMQSETVKAFIEATHERYREVLGEAFGDVVPGIFTDEPCYFMKKYYKDNRFINMIAVPWTDEMPLLFHALKGYSLLEHAEQLFLNVGDYQRLRYDFYDVATRLFVGHFTKQVADWCEQNGLAMTGHFMGEDTMSLQTEYIGAAMPHYMHMQIPGVDKLGRRITEMVSIKQLTSVKDQLNKEHALCETFGCIGQQSSFLHRKWIADWQAVLGIDLVNHHLSLYSMRGERKRDYPPNFFLQQPWWPYERGFSDYLARLSWAAGEGKRQVDILVIHPIAGVWSEYTPWEADEEAASRRKIEAMDKELDRLSKALMAQHHDFHFGDEMVMETHARIGENGLEVGSHAYSIVIVPSMITLRSHTLNLLHAHSKAKMGNHVVLMSPTAERINGGVSSFVWPPEAEEAADIPGLLMKLDTWQHGRVRVDNAMTGKRAGTVFVQHRRQAEMDLFLFAHTDEVNALHTVVSFCSVDDPILLDPATGDVRQIPFTRDGERVLLDILFHPAGSMILVCGPNISNQAIEQKTASCSDRSSLFGCGISLPTWQTVLTEADQPDVLLHEPNVFRLDHLSLTLDNVEVVHDDLVPMAWYEHFYRAKDGTPFHALYPFHVASVPESPVFLVVEMAENLDSICLNGHQLSAAREKGSPLCFDADRTWKDASFVKVPVPPKVLRKGRNELELAGRKENNITGQGTHVPVEEFMQHAPTELETVFLVGDFSVRDEAGAHHYIDVANRKPNPVNITMDAYPFYAGTMTLRYQLDCDQPENGKILRLQDVQAACVAVRLNGHPLGEARWAPWEFDVTGLVKTGLNTVDVTLATTLFNLLGPNHIADVLERPGVGPYTWVDQPKFTETLVLQAFGAGSVQLLS